MIALLPMKAHSDRVPNKNNRELNGKPLFYHIADTLRTTRIFQNLVINTDSEEIAQLALNRYGPWVIIHERPRNLCGDFVSMNLIIADDISRLGLNEDYMQTHSTNPFLKPSTIEEAAAIYKKNVESNISHNLFSVNEYKSRFFNAKLDPLNHDIYELKRTQDLSPIFEENSNFYFFSGVSFMEKQNRITKNAKVYTMSSCGFEALDIDTEQQWQLAEQIAKLQKI